MSVRCFTKVSDKLLLWKSLNANYTSFQDYAARPCSAAGLRNGRL